MNAWTDAGLVLQRADAQHVIDALVDRFDVAVEHRDVGAHAEAVRRAMDLQVAVGAALVVADLAAHPLGEDLRAAARQRIEPGIHQLAQHLLVGPAVEVGEERDLDRGKALEVDVGPDPLEAAQHVQVVVERQIGMQAVDDVDFGQRLMRPRAQLVPELFERHRVRPGIARAAAARTNRTDSWRRRRWSPRDGC